MIRAAFYTLGCKVNQYETEAVSELFAREGFEIVDFEALSDVYVINTCTVTNLSARKSRQMIAKARRTNSQALIVVTGCYAQVSKEEVEKIAGVDLVTGTKDRAKLVELVKLRLTDKSEVVTMTSVDDISTEKHFENLQISSFSERTRAYIKIQDGCNNYCAYCIIPFARGPVRSKSIEEIIKEVESLTRNGYKEIVLTGIHIASYGKDIGKTLLDVFRSIIDIPDLYRIRIGSLEPNVITDEFVAYVSTHSKICNQFHLSLQSGCDKILVAMNRKYDSGMYRESVQKLKDSIEDVAITTDIMVGFPGETKEDFDKSYEFAREMGFAKMHVFKFSPRKGTKAYSMLEQVDSEEKEQRSKKLIELSDELMGMFYKSFEGKVIKVLIETGEPDGYGFMSGMTSNYIKVLVKCNVSLKGSIADVLLVKAQKEYVEGVIRD